MQKEFVASGESVEQAIQRALEVLGVGLDSCDVEVLETPKKSLFGKVKGEAVVKVVVIKDEQGNQKLVVAQEYLRNILDAMGLKSIALDVEEKEDGATITFNGDGMAVLIGHHGETLDALQYLIALTCNRFDGDYYRISLDCGNYREKREATLEGLANRIADKVKKTGRSQFLEPMNPYERRIIHSVVSDIDGVISKSRGEEPNRKVVIMSAASDKPPVVFKKNTNRKEDVIRPLKPYKQERSMEEILKNDFKQKEDSAELYSKIEF